MIALLTLWQWVGILNAFIPPQPFPSWGLNEQTCQWQAPIAYPDDGQIYNWDEATLSWVLQEGV